ncbi:ABC transporter substrate-binding protein [Acuticoccus mangrovi]|uniref:Extracellular solute-binding protein n=1 Tax=Acuticoccus mangrovi TaxID=2796142 RepID=A0A934MGZ6_9HYPH|nr:extracellular solute-binding protein [Acuticoccus mangrovi]MBJ3776425.1 extracellular solute-binding protein [Acuticoccus mangrovi]
MTKVDPFAFWSRGIGRRQFLAGSTALGAMAATGLGPRRAHAEETLNILTWPGHADPAVVGPFEEKYGVDVVAKEYVGGENMLALVNQSPPGTYDVVLSDAEYVVMLRDGGFIEEMDPADYPFDSLFPEFKKFPGHWLDDKLYSMIIRFGYLGLAYRTDALTKEEVESYAIMWDEKVKGGVGFFDWYLPSMGCLSLYNGNEKPFDIDDAAFDKLKETLFSLAPQSSGFYSMADTFSSLTSGAAKCIPGIGDWITLLLAKDGVPVDATVPKEGGIQWTESMSIMAGSTKKDLAKAFIQYMTSAEGQMRSAMMPAYNASIPSKPGWEMLNAEHPDEAVRLRMTFDDRNVLDEYAEGKIHIRRTPVQQDIETWNDAWTEFKSL